MSVTYDYFIVLGPRVQQHTTQDRRRIGCCKSPSPPVRRIGCMLRDGRAMEEKTNASLSK
jgi:hypothetical protein